MAGNKFLNLLEVLTKATEENRIRWETTAHDNGYRTLLQAGFVEVGEELSWNDELGEYAPPPVYVASLYDSQGRLADRTDFNQTLLERLHSLARRQALGADQLVENMLDELVKPGGKSSK